MHLLRRCETARRQIEDAEQTITEAQRWCEEQILSQEEPPVLTLVFPGREKKD